MTISLRTIIGSSFKTTQDGYVELVKNSSTTAAISEIDDTDYQIFSSCANGYSEDAYASCCAFSISVELTSTVLLTFRTGNAPGTSTDTARMDYGVYALEV